jgi:hypothetical protein
MLHTLLILWLWSERPEEEGKGNDKDGDELEVILEEHSKNAIKFADLAHAPDWSRRFD